MQYSLSIRPSPHHGGISYFMQRTTPSNHESKFIRHSESGLIDDRRGRPGEACAIDGTIEAAKFPDGQMTIAWIDFSSASRLR